MAQRKKETKEKSEWRDFPPENYAAVAEKMVHFSFKNVNSNISPGGIRLGAEDGLPLPYVSARALLDKGVLLDVDYTAQSGPLSKIVAGTAKQIRQVIAGELPDKDGTPVANLKEIQAACQTVAATRLETGCHKVSPRLRQLLLPRGNSYVSVSPLGAAGLNVLINQKVDAHNALHKEKKDASQKGEDIATRPIHSAQFGIGGSNTQNVGALIRAMQSPLYFRAPQESQRFKAALSIYYKGISLRLPHDLALAYRNWRMAMKQKNDGRMPSNMTVQEEDKLFVRRIIGAVLSRGQRALAFLADEPIQKNLPDGGQPLVSIEVDPVVRGAIDPALREPDWAYRFGWHMANQFAGYEFRDSFGQVEATFDMSNEQIALMARWIKEEVR